MCLREPPRRASNKIEFPSLADRSQPYASFCQLENDTNIFVLVIYNIIVHPVPAYPQLKKSYNPKLEFGIKDNRIFVQVILNT